MPKVRLHQFAGQEEANLSKIQSPKSASDELTEEGGVLLIRNHQSPIRIPLAQPSGAR